MIVEEPKNKIITFGCRLNNFESQSIKKALDIIDEKNLIVFNSCAVTAEAEKELRATIRKEKKLNPQAKIVITGCASQIDPEKYAKMSEVDFIVGNADKTKAESYNFLKNPELKYKNQIQENSHPDKIFQDFKNKNSLNLSEDEHAKIRVNDIMSVQETAPQLASYFENQTRAFLEIQNGCNHRCTFCIIPFGRGNSRSVPFGVIVEQTKKMLEAGHQEIVLTGVDISDYGKDLPTSMTLSQMIKRLLKMVPDLKRLRLSSIDVAEIDDEFIEIMANEPRLMPYLHLSVQSGDDTILKRMKRRHNRKQILEFCHKIRQNRPDITFGADIIAGFPTEDEQMFANSLSLIQEADLIFTHIFPYSARHGTPASKMPQLEKKIIKERAKILRKAGENQLNQYLARQVGKEFRVLIEKNQRGKTENFLDVKINSSQELLENNIYSLKINSLTKNQLIVN